MVGQFELPHLLQILLVARLEIEMSEVIWVGESFWPTAAA